MTVSTELSHEEYVGNGVTTDFDFRFRIFEGKHLIVVVADSDGIETTLKNGTDYTIVGAGSYHGGKVVLNKPLAKGWKILLERDLPVVQETDLRNQGKFFAEVHEDAFDYLTMLIQKALGTFSLSLRKPTYLSNYYDAKGNRIANLAPPKTGSDATNKDYVDNSIKDIDSKTLRVKDKPINALPNTEQRANKILAFDNNGQPITVLPESGSASDVLIELASPSGAGLIGYNDRNVNEKLSEFISVKDFGAKGDGKSDDTNCIRLAYENSNGGIYFPSGKYVITNTVIFDKDTFFGTGVTISVNAPVDGIYITSGKMSIDGNKPIIKYNVENDELLAGKWLVTVIAKDNSIEGLFCNSLHLEGQGYKNNGLLLLADGSESESNKYISFCDFVALWVVKCDKGIEFRAKERVSLKYTNWVTANTINNAFLSNRKNITLDGSIYYKPSDINMGREVSGNIIKAQSQSWSITDYNLLCKSSRNSFHIVDWDTHTMLPENYSVILEGESNNLDLFCEPDKVYDKKGLNSIQFLFQSYKTKPSYQTLPEGTDLNTCIKIGKFSLFSVSNYLNAPAGIGSYGTLEVSYAAGSNVIIHKIETVNSLKILLRSSSDSVKWTDWGEFSRVHNPNFTGKFISGCLNKQPDAEKDLNNSQMTWYINETTNTLFFAVKYSTGETKWGQIKVS